MAEVECQQRQGDNIEQADNRISKPTMHPIDIVHLPPMKVRVETSAGVERNKVKCARWKAMKARTNKPVSRIVRAKIVVFIGAKTAYFCG